MERIRIKARRDGFRRAGVAHRAEGTDHDTGDFTEEEWERLRGEPMLTVTAVEVEDPDTDPPAGDDDGADTAPLPESLLGSGRMSGDVEIAGDVALPLGRLVAFAHGISGLSVAEWNAQAEDVREEALVRALAILRATHTAAQADEKGGKPNVKAVEAGLREAKFEPADINAVERDAAWEVLPKPKDTP